MCSSDFFLCFLALLFPPLPVWVKCGICSADSVINILLCVLGFVPGLLHSWYIIAKYPESSSHDYQRVPENTENGRVAYVIVPPQGHPAPKPYNHHAQTQGQHGQHQHGYGTVPGHHAQTYAQVAASSSNTPQAPTYAQVASSSSNNDGDDGAAPPPYNEAVGDHKVQTRN
jgi:uncharacterized membrane protein YqaE (UPF0057 family)